MAARADAGAHFHCMTGYHSGWIPPPSCSYGIAYWNAKFPEWPLKIRRCELRCVVGLPKERAGMCRTPRAAMSLPSMPSSPVGHATLPNSAIHALLQTEKLGAARQKGPAGGARQVTVQDEDEGVQLRFASAAICELSFASLFVTRAARSEAPAHTPKPPSPVQRSGSGSDIMFALQRLQSCSILQPRMAQRPGLRVWAASKGFGKQTAQPKPKPEVCDAVQRFDAQCAPCKRCLESLPPPPLPAASRCPPTPDPTPRIHPIRRRARRCRGRAASSSAGSSSRARSRCGGARRRSSPPRSPASTCSLRRMPPAPRRAWWSRSSLSSGSRRWRPSRRSGARSSSARRPRGAASWTPGGGSRPRTFTPTCSRCPRRCCRGTTAAPTRSTRAAPLGPARCGRGGGWGAQGA